ncbi:DinB family protein OS=Streptomyces rimosus subsp. rimosus (strain ATCC / DSM 40260/ JCM 4667 / NRRL 2234) OX=1265868 GN=SRIM_005755 PE=4 SV=1 [Streptomyces rimosus subsp. rimosus]
MDADERTTLESWLDFYRTTLALECDGLTEQQLREASAPPSTLTLLGLVRHLAAVERFWFRRVLVQEDAPTLFSSDPDASSANSGFDLDESATYEDARRIWQAEIEHARELRFPRAGGHRRVPGRAGHPALIYTHMTAEYARHCGQADLIRERIDGSTGV